MTDFHFDEDNKLSSLALANIEALAQNEASGGWDENKDETTSSMNGNVYKKSVIVTCYKGGAKSSCNSGCTYQVKNSDGTWTSWLRC